MSNLLTIHSLDASTKSKNETTPSKTYQKPLRYVDSPPAGNNENIHQPSFQVDITYSPRSSPKTYTRKRPTKVITNIKTTPKKYNPNKSPESTKKKRFRKEDNPQYAEMKLRKQAEQLMLKRIDAGHYRNVTNQKSRPLKVPMSPNAPPRAMKTTRLSSPATPIHEPQQQNYSFPRPVSAHVSVNQKKRNSIAQRPASALYGRTTPNQYKPRFRPKTATTRKKSNSSRIQMHPDTVHYDETEEKPLITTFSLNSTIELISGKSLSMRPSSAISRSRSTSKSKRSRPQSAITRSKQHKPSPTNRDLMNVRSISLSYQDGSRKRHSVQTDNDTVRRLLREHSQRQSGADPTLFKSQMKGGGFKTRRASVHVASKFDQMNRLHLKQRQKLRKNAKTISKQKRHSQLIEAVPLHI